MAPRITIRNDPIPMDIEVLLHFGNGDQRSAQKVAKEVVDRHDFWLGVIDDYGRFAVSVYALVGITEDVIAREMPHRVYGRSTVGAVRATGFELVGSTIQMQRMPPGLERIQPWHSTVFLCLDGFEGKLTGHPERSVYETEVRAELAVLFSLFERVPNRWTNPFAT
jgi:FAD/FMN-containing dehydrogenase